MHLKQPGVLTVLVLYSQKTKKELESLCKLEIQTLFIKNELDQACFQHDMAYGKSKDLIKKNSIR